MMNLKKFSKKLLKSQSGQGATEYILLVVVIIALVTAFKGPIMEAIGEKTGDLKGKIMGFEGN
ncbi:MAG TPA: hypothetical protein PLJ21_07435 [Pseudobdellovibrionaceae bacterium]|nr:hypothetical protein [Pseudobdellovibrionaceae bacterium]